MRVRDYAGPLGVLAAGIIGFSLLCSVSALAMDDLNSHHHIPNPLNIVDLAVGNLSTSAALTQQAVTAFVPTPTVVSADTASLTPVSLPSHTFTSRASLTPHEPTRTHRPRSIATDTARPIPTRTRTRVPTATNTPLPPPTNTVPPPTDTPAPPPTDTPAPPPTEPPPPTDTPPQPTEPPATIAPNEILIDTPTLQP